MRYCRYADDFLIGIIGSRDDAQAVMNAVRSFVQDTMKLNISEEKSSIRPAKEGAKFLGYWIRTYTGEGTVKKRRGTRHTLVRTISESVQLRIPQGRPQQFCQAKRYGNYALTKAIHRPELTILSDAEIVLQYNGELRGFANFYALAQNAKRDLSKLEFVWKTSLFKTLANKHRTSVQKIVDQLRTPTGYTLVVQEEKRTRIIPLFQLKNLHASMQVQAAIDLEPNTAWVFSRTEIIRRLSARKCEYCGAEGAVAVHHIRKLKDVSKAKERWQRLMIARRRKTLVMCVQCHTRLHNGTLPSPVIAQEGA
jgi:RNA-directed DNA polymerase